MFFVFQKFETMIFVVYQKTTNIVGYFFQTLVFQENFLLEGKSSKMSLLWKNFSVTKISNHVISLEMKIQQNEPFVKKFEHYKIFYQKWTFYYVYLETDGIYFMSKLINFLFQGKLKDHIFQILSCALRRAPSYLHLEFNFFCALQ